MEEKVYAKKEGIVFDQRHCAICSSSDIELIDAKEEHNQSSKKFYCGSCLSNYWVLYDDNDVPKIVTYMLHPSLGVRRTIYLD